MEEKTLTIQSEEEIPEEISSDAYRKIMEDAMDDRSNHAATVENIEIRDDEVVFELEVLFGDTEKVSVPRPKNDSGSIDNILDSFNLQIDELHKLTGKLLPLTESREIDYERLSEETPPYNTEVKEDNQLVKERKKYVSMLIANRLSLFTVGVVGIIGAFLSSSLLILGLVLTVLVVVGVLTSMILGDKVHEQEVDWVIQ